MWLMSGSVAKRPGLWAGITFLLGLYVAAYGLAVNNPELSRLGVALAVSFAPLLLLYRHTYQSGSFFRWRRSILLALVWATLGLSGYWLWQWALEPVYANVFAFLCGVSALAMVLFAAIAIKHPWMAAAEQQVAAMEKNEGGWNAEGEREEEN